MQKFLKKVLQADDWAHHHTAMILAGVFLSGFMAFWQLLMPQMETHAAWNPSYCQDNVGTLAIPVEECDTLAALYLQLDLGNLVTYAGWFQSDGSDIGTWEGIDLSGNNISRISLFPQWQGTGQNITFSGFSQLEYVSIWSMGVDSIDISNNLLLKEAVIRYSPIASLNASNNTLLETLDIEGNLITSIDVSNLTNLKTLALSNNRITYVDITNNIALENFSHRGWAWFDGGIYALTSVDLSQNVNLINVWLYANSLTNIDLSNKPNLTYVDIRQNDITGSLDLSASTQLAYIDAEGNEFTSVSLPASTWMSTINFTNNNLTSIDLSPIVGSSLFYLYLQNNFISDLGTNFDQFSSIGMMSPLWMFANEMNGNCLEANNLSPSYISFLNTEFANRESNQTCGRDVSEDEYNTLVALYNATDGANWTNNDGWLEDNSVCDWYGITCGGSNSYVQSIHLQTNGLSGYIPPLQDLSNLVDFYADNWNDDNLADNILDVDLAAFAGIPALQWLSIYAPHSVTGSLDSLVVTGNIGTPRNPVIGVVNQLKHIQLSNPATEPFTYTPAQLAQFPALNAVYLKDNILIGDLWALSTRTGMEYLDLSCTNTIELCQATGSLDFIDTMPLLKTLNLNALNLHWTLPASINTLEHLEYLALDENYFTGSLPTLDASTQLIELNLSNNAFQGTLPESWGNLTNLIDLSVWGRGMQNRGIVGSLPSSWANLTNLEQLNISFTKLTGPLPASWSALTNLDELKIFFNNIKGEIPDTWSVFTTQQFQRFWLQNNNLEWDVPTWMENMDQIFKIENNCLNLDSVAPASSLESNLNENAGSWTNQNNCLSDMLITKSLSTNDLNPGEVFTMTIHYENNGTQKAPRFEINEVLGSHLELLSSIPSQSSAIVNKQFGTGGDVCYDGLMYNNEGAYYDYMADVLAWYLAWEGPLPEEWTSQDIFDGAFIGFLWDANLSIQDLSGPTYFNDPLLTTGWALTTILCGAGQGIQLVWSQIRPLYADVGQQCLPLFGVDYRSYRDECGAGGEQGYRWDVGDVLPGEEWEIVLTLRVANNASVWSHEMTTYLIVDGENVSDNVVPLVFIVSSPSNPHWGGWSSGGGGSSSGPGNETDEAAGICEVRDCSDSSYDDVCGVCNAEQIAESVVEKQEHATAPTSFVPDAATLAAYIQAVGDDIQWSIEQIAAFLFAKAAGLTTMADFTTVRPFDGVTRAEFSKLLVGFLENVLGRKADGSRLKICSTYKDVDKTLGDLELTIYKSCMHKVMGLQNDGGTPLDTFNPHDVMTRKYVVTTLSRVIWGNKYDNGDPFYVKHMQAMQDAGLVSLPDPEMPEQRINAFTIMMRMAEQFDSLFTK